MVNDSDWFDGKSPQLSNTFYDIVAVPPNSRRIIRPLGGCRPPTISRITNSANIDAKMYFYYLFSLFSDSPRSCDEKKLKLRQIRVKVIILERKCEMKKGKFYPKLLERLGWPRRTLEEMEVDVITKKQVTALLKPVRIPKRLLKK